MQRLPRVGSGGFSIWLQVPTLAMCVIADDGGLAESPRLYYENQSMHSVCADLVRVAGAAVRRADHLQPRD